MMPEFQDEHKNWWKMAFFTITSIFGHNSWRKGGIDFRLVSFCPDSRQILDCEKIFQKKSIMADFGLKNCNFRTNFIVLALFLSNGCFISPGFAFISSVHLSSIALWQKFARKIHNGGFGPKKGVFWANFMVVALFLRDCCCKSSGFGINTSVNMRWIALM